MHAGVHKCMAESWHVAAMVHTWRSENTFQGSFLSIVRHGDWTLCSGLCSRCFTSLGHLAGLTLKGDLDLLIILPPPMCAEVTSVCHCA